MGVADVQLLPKTYDSFVAVDDISFSLRESFGKPFAKHRGEIWLRASFGHTLRKGLVKVY